MEDGVARANRAGQVLESIVHAVETAYQRANQSTQVAQDMNKAVNQLVAAVESVSAVVEENTAATEEMTAGAHEVTQSIDAIAGVSADNNAAAEEVSASAGVVNAQVAEVSSAIRDLEHMAQSLQEIISQFKLAGDESEGQANLRVRPDAESVDSASTIEPPVAESQPWPGEEPHVLPTGDPIVLSEADTQFDPDEDLIADPEVHPG